LLPVSFGLQGFALLLAVGVEQVDFANNTDGLSLPVVYKGKLSLIEVIGRG